MVERNKMSDGAPTQPGLMTHEQAEKMLAAMQAMAFPQQQQQKKAVRPEGKRIYLRNDAPSLRVVHDCDGRAHQIGPSQAMEIEVPLKVISMIENDVAIKARRGMHNVLRIVNREAAERANEGSGPPPSAEFTAEQNHMMELASQAEGMDWREFQDQARTVLAERYPPGRPSKVDIIAALQLHGRGASSTGG